MNRAPAATTARYSGDGLRHFVTQVLAHLNMPIEDARVAAIALVDADLAGVDTHGTANLADHLHYVPGLRSGFVEPRCDVHVLRDAPVAAAWDSNRGFGPVVAHRAMTVAIEKAAEVGVGMISVRHGRHIGAHGYFAEMAARNGMLGIALANTPWVGVFGDATAPIAGTSPFAFAAPVGHGPPLVVDMALTAVAGTRVMRAAAADEQIPEGWIVDSDGKSSTDPSWGVTNGGFEMLGGAIAGHKGYGLSQMIESFAMLAGSGPGFRWEPYSAEWTQGQWFAACRVDLFLDPVEFLAGMRALADHVHHVPTRSGGHVLLPGERRAMCRARRSEQGIPLATNVVERLEGLAAELGLEMPAPLRFGVT